MIRQFWLVSKFLPLKSLENSLGVTITNSKLVFRAGLVMVHSTRVLVRVKLG